MKNRLSQKRGLLFHERHNIGRDSSSCVLTSISLRPFISWLNFPHQSNLQVWQRKLRWRLYCVFPPGQEDLGCEVNGVTYQEGQTFQPSCDTYCYCTGGGVSCKSACPLTARLPTPDCPNPQFIRLPGKCCREWVCENLENTVIQDAITGELS